MPSCPSPFPLPSFLPSFISIWAEHHPLMSPQLLSLNLSIYITEKCGTSSSQHAFFTEHSAQFFDSLLASILVHADVRRSRFEESATKMSSILTLDETVQLLDIFLMFVSCRTDETSFRQWWKAFHSQFLDFIYGEWQNSRSIRGSKSDKSCIVGSLHVHISVASMLSDWLRHPLHSGSLLLQEDGQLCSETLEFLVGFCDRLLSSLLSSHEPNMKLLKSVVALCSDLLWVWFWRWWNECYFL